MTDARGLVLAARLRSQKGKHSAKLEKLSSDHTRTDVKVTISPASAAGMPHPATPPTLCADAINSVSAQPGSEVDAGRLDCSAYSSVEGGEAGLVRAGGCQCEAVGEADVVVGA
jgi:hypothetical protein